MASLLRASVSARQAVPLAVSALRQSTTRRLSHQADSAATPPPFDGAKTITIAGQEVPVSKILQAFRQRPDVGVKPSILDSLYNVGFKDFQRERQAINADGNEAVMDLLAKYGIKPCHCSPKTSVIISSTPPEQLLTSTILKADGIQEADLLQPNGIRMHGQIPGTANNYSDRRPTYGTARNLGILPLKLDPGTFAYVVTTHTANKYGAVEALPALIGPQLRANPIKGKPDLSFVDDAKEWNLLSPSKIHLGGIPTKGIIGIYQASKTGLNYLGKGPR
jgi:hypothetical protein